MLNFVYRLVLSEAAPNIKVRNLTTTIDSGAPVVTPQNNGDEVKYLEGSSVVLSLIDVDTIGQASDPSEPTMFTVGTLPAIPGPVGLEFVRTEPSDVVVPV